MFKKTYGLFGVNEVKLSVTGMRDLVIKVSRESKIEGWGLTLFWIKEYPLPGGGTYIAFRSFSPVTWRKDAFPEGTPQHLMRPMAKKMATKIIATMELLGAKYILGRKLPENCWPRTRGQLWPKYLELFPPEKKPDELI